MEFLWDFDRVDTDSRKQNVSLWNFDRIETDSGKQNASLWNFDRVEMRVETDIRKRGTLNLVVKEG